MSRRTIIFAVEFRIVRLIFLEHIVNGGQKHSGDGNNRFLVTPPLFQGEVTAADFRKLLGPNSAQGALDKQQLGSFPLES